MAGTCDPAMTILGAGVVPFRIFSIYLLQSDPVEIYL